MIWLAVCLDVWAIVVIFFWTRFWRWVDDNSLWSRLYWPAFTSPEVTFDWSWPAPPTLSYDPEDWG